MIVNAAKCYFADHPPGKIILIFLHVLAGG
jgi:hypothetical protein